MRKMLMAFGALMVGLGCFAEVTVQNVTAQQRYPWNGKVDVVVTLSGAADEAAAAMYVFAATNSATQAALPVYNVTRNGSLAGSGTTWTQKFIWDTDADLGEVRIDDVALAVKTSLGVQLWEGGPYWAECNVGAVEPEEYGYYFRWGDTVGYAANTNNATWNGSVWRGVTWVSSTGATMSPNPFSSSTCPTSGKSNSQLQSEGYIDSTGNLVAAHDAATARLGAPWRIPTDAEMAALVSNCTTTWTTRNGVYGRLVTGKGAYASKSIFLPAAGYGVVAYLYGYTGSDGLYWSSTPNSDYSDHACSLNFDSGSFRRSNDYRDFGQSVRPVRGFAH